MDCVITTSAYSVYTIDIPRCNREIPQYSCVGGVSLVIVIFRIITTTTIPTRVLYYRILSVNQVLVNSTYYTRDYIIKVCNVDNMENVALDLKL